MSYSNKLKWRSNFMFGMFVVFRISQPYLRLKKSLLLNRIINSFCKILEKVFKFWNVVKIIGDYHRFSNRYFFDTSSCVSRELQKHQYRYRNRKNIFFNITQACQLHLNWSATNKKNTLLQYYVMGRKCDFELFIC